MKRPSWLTEENFAAIFLGSTAGLLAGAIAGTLLRLLFTK